MQIRNLSWPARAVSLGTAVAVASCASSTTISSQPAGAALYLNGERVGSTPYTMTDTKIVGSTTTVRLEMPGYEPTMGAISRNEEFELGACIGGVLVLVPFLWIMGYKGNHNYELRPAGAQGYPPGPQSPWNGPAPAQYPPAQYPPAQYPPAQYPPAQYPPAPTQPAPNQPVPPRPR